FAQGALLFRIDDTEAKLTLQSQKSEFLKDLASVLPDFKVDFPKNYDKWLKYFESVNLDESLPELPAFETNKEKTYLATKNIFTKYYAIKSAEFNLSKYNVHAPFSGTVSEVNLYVGAFANSGAKVCKILKTSNLELKVPVETSDINWLTIGNEVDIKTEDNAQHWKGQIARIGDFVNPTTQSIDVFIHVLSNEHKIYEGMYLEATMPGAIIKDAMEIPRNAVFAGSKVYTMKDSLLESKNIKILKINSESVVFQGLNEGEELVIEPLVGASENLKVAKLRENIDVEVTKKNEGFEVKKTKFEPEENKDKPKEKN
ncbi:MAG: efflux RND transporter periplasmic adaptor subunit, partial [Flammeovirgaceae bacterium]|nr:efflux RND transporter periplasmic adaptor subunit [Flammeovirgaceae bacterium]